MRLNHGKLRLLAWSSVAGLGALLVLAAACESKPSGQEAEQSGSTA